MSRPHGLLRPAVLRQMALAVMFAITVSAPPASAQCASAMQERLLRGTLPPARDATAPDASDFRPAALPDRTDSIQQGDTAALPTALGEPSGARALDTAVVVLAAAPPMSVAVDARRIAMLVHPDSGAVVRVGADSVAAARHPERTRFWRFAHVGMAVGAVVGLGYGLSQAPHCACGYFLGGTTGMVVAYTGAGSLFGFDGGSVVYLVDRVVRRASKHARHTTN